MIFITGDTHGDFRRIAKFTEKLNTSKEDIMIVLGDAGINYYEDNRDTKLKNGLSELPITFFCIHGNHEKRPQNIESYIQVNWNGGIVFAEPEYPDLIFAKDGEICNLNGEKMVIIGGAYSVDKKYRIANNLGWWEDEQPSPEIKSYAEQQLEKHDWTVDMVLSHTCPLKYEPREVFLPGINQMFVDKSTEQWLDRIEEKLSYDKWYCGHYHTDKVIDKINFLFEEIEIFE